MYQGKNPSALRSRDWLMEALLSLLREEKYAGITVKDICKKADLSRQTFYQIFDSKDEMMAYRFEVLFSDFSRQQENFEQISLGQLAQGFFGFFGEHRGFMEILIHNNMAYLIEQKFEQYLPQITLFRRINETEEYPDYSVAYMAGALCQILIHWYEKGMDIPAERIGEITEGIIRGKMMQDPSEISGSR